MSDAHLIEDGNGTVTVPAGTLAGIVTRAAESVDGAKVRRRGVDVKLRDGSAQVTLDLNARYGTVLPELGRDVQRAVASALTAMCGLAAEAVDLHVEELE